MKDIKERVEFARRIALTFIRRNGIPAWIQDDLISAAQVGLVEAMRRFDQARPEPFEARAATGTL